MKFIYHKDRVLLFRGKYISGHLEKNGSGIYSSPTHYWRWTDDPNTLRDWIKSSKNRIKLEKKSLKELLIVEKEFNRTAKKLKKLEKTQN